MKSGRERSNVFGLLTTDDKTGYRVRSGRRKQCRQTLPLCADQQPPAGSPSPSSQFLPRRGVQLPVYLLPSALAFWKEPLLSLPGLLWSLIEMKGWGASLGPKPLHLTDGSKRNVLDWFPSLNIHVYCSGPHWEWLFLDKATFICWGTSQWSAIIIPLLQKHSENSCLCIIWYSSKGAADVGCKMVRPELHCSFFNYGKYPPWGH